MYRKYVFCSSKRKATKKMEKKKKILLIRRKNPEWKDLADTIF